MKINRERLEQLGFKYIEAGTKLQTGDVYTNDGFETYEIGEYTVGDEYNLMTVSDHGWVHIDSTSHWSGDPIVQSIFSGKIDTVEDLIKLFEVLDTDILNRIIWGRAKCPIGMMAKDAEKILKEHISLK
jgi:hypothetical protein